MEELAGDIGFKYKIFEYTGPKQPTSVVVAMGAAALTIQATVKDGAEIGVIHVRLLRPWSQSHFISVLPQSVKRIRVLIGAKAVVNAAGFDLTMAHDLST